MDGFPGVITSDDDFGVNSERHHGDGDDHFPISRMGSRTASRSSCAPARRSNMPTSIDDYVRIMLDGNNGGYANDWLLGDNKTGEIAQFELGLKAHQVWRTKDGYFVGSNFARDPDVLAKDTTFDIHNLETSPNARRIRWEQLMKESKGKIDVALAEKFMADHFDSYQRRRTLTSARCAATAISRRAA